MILPPCPHCGDDKKGFFRSVTITEVVEQWFTEDGHHEGWEVLETRIPDGKRVRCFGCHKVRKDVEIVGSRVVVRTSYLPSNSAYVVSIIRNGHED